MGGPVDVLQVLNFCLHKAEKEQVRAEIKETYFMCTVFLNIRQNSQNILKLNMQVLSFFVKKKFTVLFFTSTDWGLPGKTTDR